jgi:hypothetical protein
VRFVPQDKESERDIDLLYTECTVQRWNCISNEIDGCCDRGTSITHSFVISKKKNGIATYLMVP